MRRNSPEAGSEPSADGLLVEQIRRGDAEASRQFFREQYPSIYRYLLWLTHRPEAAEDLAQETFVRAWRHLDTFDEHGSLRAWLHRIAHREFLRALRSQRNQASLEEIPEPAEPRSTGWMEAAELREVIRQLPIEEGEVVVLHYLQGYNCQEIAQIVRAPVGTVKYRLSVARTHLQRELGEGDLTYLNEPPVSASRWSWLPLEQMRALEARLTSLQSNRQSSIDRACRDAGEAERSKTDAARHRDAEIVDARLTRCKVTLAFKGTALSDVCAHLRAESGVHIEAGRSVADEKVTLFCTSAPLREVMRQLSRPFGYTWLRTGKPDQYRYELVEDLRSQLLDEELQNRDRNTALLALERELQWHRGYLDLSPDEVLARARNAAPEEKKRLELLASHGWGPTQMYFRLSPQDLAALRAGQELIFSADPRSPASGNPAQPLPPDVAREIAESLRDDRIRIRDGKAEYGSKDSMPDGLPPTAVPEAHPRVTLRLIQKELGHFQLSGESGLTTLGAGLGRGSPLATAANPVVHNPQNGVANARLARDPSLRPRVTVQPHSSCCQEVKVTTADVLEALHHATGLPVIADYYTRLYPMESVSLQDQPLFEALNHLADTMRLRWHKETDSRETGRWLQFRSATYYDDRLKEVPNRLLARWVAARHSHGTLLLDDLVEIAQLSDAQLDAADMAEGAKDCLGLAEWDLARDERLRLQLRFLGSLTPPQRQDATAEKGLRFTRLSLAQQQQFLSLPMTTWGLHVSSLEELAAVTLRVDHSLPGWFEWQMPDPMVDQGWPRFKRSPVRERTREAALQAARRIDPQAEESRVVPSQRDLAFIYTRPEGNGLRIYWVRTNGNFSHTFTVAGQ